nr:M20/M25/M40 family metallo-hydrolase [uncultured Blautia sp.]
MDEFIELTQIDAVSYRERKIADVLKEKLIQLGFEVQEDQAGAAYGSSTGNLYGFLKGSLPGGAILLCAHMDTVEPGLGKRPVFHEDGRITSSGDTILGADDVCGLVEILEAVRFLKENQIPHRDIEVVFPIAEEVFIKGTDQLDFSKLRSKEAYVLDLSGAPGAAALRAPSLISFSVTVKGKAAHAGFNPENGIHAIQIMSQVIAGLPMGHIGDDTTFNIGTVTGGKLVNIVPEKCTCKGEIRSYSHQKALDLLEKVKVSFAEAVREKGGSFSMEHEVNLHAYETDRDAQVVKRFERACEKLSLPCTLTETFGGSDNNNFALHGISGIVISCGMYQCHSTEEYTYERDLKTGAALVAALVSERETEL